MNEEEMMAAMEAAMAEAPQEEAHQEEASPGEGAPALEQAIREQENPLEQLDQGPLAKYEIVINPDVYADERDALAVAWDEALRCVMEEMAFIPIGDPTQKQRNFFADTAYANDETMLRRTIMARIATFDDSVTDPQPQQIEETVEFLVSIQDAGIPRSEEEQATVQRMINGLKEIYTALKEKPRPNEEAQPEEVSTNDSTEAVDTSDEDYLGGKYPQDGGSTQPPL